jgi:5-methylcytosine-specific restriction endonuclease McrA
MTWKKSKPPSPPLERVMADIQRQRRLRDSDDYRQRALKILPWICAKCGREFSGKTLRQLTVHHKDHDHDHNPPDGSNWELLCVYCHDNQHQRLLEAGEYGLDAPGRPEEPAPGHRPFADLQRLLRDRQKPPRD